MFLLIAFAFLAGLVTVLSPCVLPLLPIILSSTAESGKQKPLGVVVGFVLSFTFFTLFLSSLVQLFNFPADNLRAFSIVILIFFGLSLLVPKIQLWLEILFGRLANYVPTVKGRPSFVGGLLIGFSLGLLWTPCVGPILASVISLSITGEVSTQSALITFAYALGTALPMLMIMLAGSTALQKVPWLVKNTGKIQKAFGVLMVLTAIGIFFNVDRKFQTFILRTFPNYGVGLTKFEDNDQVRKALQQINKKPVDEKLMGEPMSDVISKGPVAPELTLGGAWLNSEPLTLEKLKGKVVLIDFWTYSCINCQRTLPYLRTWWEKYKDKGLVIIGVHSPEFEFEKNIKNVEAATKDFSLTYPIMQDNDFATWRAYDNHYWPAKYLIDKDGYIRYTHFGEGQYDETERVIQNLLEETGAQLSADISNPDYKIETKTPELYLGYARLQNLVSPEKVAQDKVAIYSAPKILPVNRFSFEGSWRVASEYSAPAENAVLTLNFDAKNVFLVMRPKAEKSGKVNVSLDGEQVKVIEVNGDKLYQLIELPSAGPHQLKLNFLDDNIEIYAFTFG